MAAPRDERSEFYVALPEGISAKGGCASGAELIYILYKHWCLRQDSNLDLELRRLLFYPLNYGDSIAPVSVACPELVSGNYESSFKL